MAEIAIQRLQIALLHPTTCNKIAFGGERRKRDIDVTR